MHGKGGQLWFAKNVIKKWSNVYIYEFVFNNFLNKKRVNKMQVKCTVTQRT